jgi:homopolymeric O-antigen transport system ATP-binding protein
METVGTIDFQQVTKTYHIMQRETPRLGSWVLSKAFEYLRREPFHALKDVSFHVDPGEMVGLLGSNGSGKSTILKLVAGITVPTSGSVTVEGKVASLLELGVGFHPDLTGMENIFYNGALMGMGRQEVFDHLSEIIAFSGLEEFLYEPVKHYSSGMYSRLACSVALHLNPNVLLVDEILGVGDAGFQQKGILKILELNEKGVTVLLVTHQTQTARDICDRLIWIEGGSLREEGSPAEIYSQYMRYMMGQLAENGYLHQDPVTKNGTPCAEVRTLKFDTPQEEENQIETGEKANLEIEIEGMVPQVRVVLIWKWNDGRLLNRDISEPINLDEGVGRLNYQINRWPLLNGMIRLSVILVSTDGTDLYERNIDALTIETKAPWYQLTETLTAPKASWTVR